MLGVWVLIRPWTQHCVKARTVRVLPRPSSIASAPGKKKKKKKEFCLESDDFGFICAGVLSDVGGYHVPDRRCSMRKKTLTEQMRAHRGKTKNGNISRV